ncbi:type II secretion system protein [Clostridium saudiense]|nr:type II secretion system protein [Clostridium saudiense]
MKLNKKKKGFTLIELMAVIAIVAILAAVLVPTVSGYITRAKKTALITQVRSAVNAIEVYNSTATSEKIEKTYSLKDLLPRNTNTGATGEKKSFVNQELLAAEDVSKLNLNLTYADLKAINTDENAMNNIFKQAPGEGKDKVFYYKGKEMNEAVRLEYEAPPTPPAA